MKLSDEQIKSFKELGYVFIENVFDAAEVKKMNDELPEMYGLDREEVQKEKDGKAVRTVFAAHTLNNVYSDLSRHPRIVEPAKQLLGGDVYIHQFKINAKEAFDGDLWQWHQDYGTWKNDDEMPEGLALNVGLFLDDVTQFNLFDSTLVHGSPSNMAPWNRTIVYISLNRTSNYIRKFSRPEYIAHRDFTPLTCVDDSCFK